MRKTSRINKPFWRVILLVFLLSYCYAIVRYNFFGQVPWKDLPFYILNKAISLSSFIVLTLSFSVKPLENFGIKLSENLIKAKNAFGMSGFLLSLIHVLISFMILNPAVFKKFFLANGTLSFTASLSMLGGVLSFVILWCYNLSLQERIKENKVFGEFISSKGFIVLTYFFVGMHVFFMGYKGWLTPSDWHGGLPPISLISFVIFAMGFVINLFGRKRSY